MATTIQSQQQQQQQQQPQPPSNNPQLKRLVYSKYRELLGSYNDKANSIIQSLPSYMVTEDRGFNFNVNNNNCNSSSDDNDESDNVNYGASRRLPSNIPSSIGCDPPACVQNAMMTKDKKPFTYTPGGIDLSEIKSPRMAKRIARNAQYEGVTGAPKPSPLAQPNNNNIQTAQQNPPTSLGAQAVGMPVQVFPNGPPPPPPPAPTPFLAPQNSGNIPPPPPPLQQANKTFLGPQTNGIDTRKSPTPQNFEPPPFGCRPEIKIPPNPMANLKKVPRPREKNDFWIEEYRKERSTSPMINNDANSNNSVASQNVTYQQPLEQNYREQSPSSAINSSQSPNYGQYQQQQQQYQQMSPSSPIKQYTPVQQTPTRNLQNGIDFSQQNQSPQQNRIESPFHSHDSPSLQRPLSPIRFDRQQSQNAEKQQSITPIHLRSQSQPQPSSNSPVQQQKNFGSLYIPPVSPENLNANRQQQQQQQRQQSPPLQQHLQQHQMQRSIQANNPPTPRWMAQKNPMREVPEWVKDDASPPPSPIRHVQAPESPAISNYQTTPITPQSPNYYTQSQQQQQQQQQQQSSSNNTNTVTSGFRIQITPKTTPTNQKERIIPIQLEQTPTPTRTPGTPNFGPQPFYNVNQQYGSVSSPTPSYTGSQNSGFNTPNQTFVNRNPNQFVDQGYNNIPAKWNQNQNRVTSSSSQQSSTSSSSTINNGTRIIPIAIEGQDEGPFNPNLVRGPVSSAPMVIQNDPRTLQHQHSWGGSSGQPNQSKSFRILQKITDTEDVKDTTINNNQRPQYIRQIGNNIVVGGNGNVTGSNDIPSDQMRRMQINDQDQTFMNRVRNQAPIQRSQLPRYIRQRSEYEQNGDQSPSYIHPSEQQVPESKMLYTGSAIPSRSFKLLQAMTTPENAAEMERSDVDYEQISPYQFPYPPPPPPPYWLPPPPPPPYPTYNPHINSNNWYRQSYPPSSYPPYLYSYCNYDSQNFYNTGWYHQHHPASFYNLYSGSCQILPLCKNNNNIKTPNIIVTNSSDDEKQMNENDKLKTENNSNIPKNLETKKQSSESSAIDALSRKLNEISKPELDLNMSKKDDKKYVGDCRKEIQNEDEINTPSPLGTEKSSEIDNSSDVNYSSGEDTESSSTDDLISKESKRKNLKETDRLKAVKSVTDIKVYDTEENEENGTEKSMKIGSINYRKLSEMIFGPKSDNESNNEEIEEEIESSISSCSACYTPDGHDGTDIEEPDEFTEDIEENGMEQMLSVIYEESERAGSRASTIISESECSTTIANESSNESENNDTKMNDENLNEECIENKTKHDDVNSNEDEDENSRLVTVRLPLKLSFSRSSNDENITTVIVGDSEIEDEKSTASIISKTDGDDTDNDADVSITINLPSKRRSSKDSKKSSDNNKQTDDSDSEVSFSFSLPLKKDKRVSDEAVQDSNKSNDQNILEHFEKNPVSEECEYEELHVDRRACSVPINFPQPKNESEQIKNDTQIEENLEFENELKRSRSSTPVPEEKEEDEEEYEEIEEEIEWVEEEQSESESEPESELENENEKSLQKEYVDSVKASPQMHKNCSEMDQKEIEKKVDTTHKKDDDDDEIKVDGNIKKINERKENFKTETKTSNNLDANRLSQVPHDDDSEIKISVKDRIAAFETNSQSKDHNKKSMDLLEVSSKKMLSRNSSLQKSESDAEEDDSGVTSDLSKQISETDTESEGFPELRKMTRYQRAATHSRLFKLLQEESLNSEEKDNKEKINDENKTIKNLEQGINEFFVSRPKEKIIHNVSITRKMNPESIKMAETMSQRRERLSLPLTMSNSIDADNLSTSNSPSSPVISPNPMISDKLVNELIQSLLLKKKSEHLKKLSMEKLQAAARKVLEESFDSLENTSLNSTPAITPQEFKNETTNLQNSPYMDYYETWKNNETITSNINHLVDSLSATTSTAANIVANTCTDYDILPSKAFKTLQEQSVTGKRKLWAARCPRVLSSKTVNRDLAKVTELNEQQELLSIDQKQQQQQQDQQDHQYHRSCSVVPQSNTIINEKYFDDFKRGASLSRLTDI